MQKLCPLGPASVKCLHSGRDASRFAARSAERSAPQSGCIFPELRATEPLSLLFVEGSMRDAAIVVAGVGGCDACKIHVEVTRIPQLPKVLSFSSMNSPSSACIGALRSQIALVTLKSRRSYQHLLRWFSVLTPPHLGTYVPEFGLESIQQ
ncbi:hypothetical protein BJY01DRAFT_207627 [Aspergillus pseudoustus]|uniref:Uncharacterized protein n=1 Tax=Aspergillus pseudoustus TaxID=1810923 RepID=A0ABR4KKJ6_9EURO